MKTGRKQFAEGEYEGQLMGTVRQGTGTMRFANGSVYEGEWVNGKQQGQGTLTTADGDKYSGSWKASKFDGLGTYTWAAAGKSYEGLWANGMKEGRGTHKWPDGSIYDGMWHRDQREGPGVMQSRPKGYTYDGMWRDDKKHGQGTIRYINGDTYKGLWDRGERSGIGIETKANGDNYDGAWANGKKEGSGMMKWPATGEYYFGEWMDDKQAGHGEMTMRNGDVYDGDWADGFREGEGTITLANSGHVFKGRFAEDAPEGPGVWTYNNAPGNYVKFACNFVKGQRQGLGKFTLKGDHELTCSWARDQPDPGRPNAVLRENDLVTYCPWKPDGPNLLPVFHGKGASINVRTGEVTKFNYVDGMRQKRGGGVGGAGGGATPPQRRESGFRDSQSTRELEERQTALQIHVSAAQLELEKLKEQLERSESERVALQAQLQQGSPHPNNELVKLREELLQCKHDEEETNTRLHQVEEENNQTAALFTEQENYLNHIVDHIQGCKWNSSAQDPSERMHVDIACERLSPFTVPICMHCPLHKVVELEVRKMYGNKDIKVIAKGEVITPLRTAREIEPEKDRLSVTVEFEPVPEAKTGEYISAPQIGLGAHGAVYTGTRAATGYPVIIKALQESICAVLERNTFRSQLGAVNSLRCPNLVQYFAFNPNGVIVRESTACSLRTLLQRVELNLDHIVSIAVGIATGMNYLHRQRIVHKNLHSNNILFDDHGTPKICDFELPTSNKVVSLAEIQIPYLPPQMYTQTFNDRSDVWQFGVLFSEMMQGEVPNVEIAPAFAPQYLSQQKNQLRASEKQEIDQLHAKGVDEVTVALCLKRRNACMEIIRTSAGQYVDQMPTAASLVPPLVNMCLYLPEAERPHFSVIKSILIGIMQCIMNNNRRYVPALVSSCLETLVPHLHQE